MRTASIAVAGRYVAFVHQVGRARTRFDAVRVMELTRGVMRHAAFAWRGFLPGGERALIADAVTVNARGSVAWVARAIGRDGSVARQLRVLDRRGNLLFGTRDDIDPASLRLTLDRVRWRDGAGTRSRRVS